MVELNLREYQSSGPYRLSVNDRDALAEGVKVNVAPAPGEDNAYILTPGSNIGAVEIGGLSVLIEPKIGIPQVLSLACYALGRVKFHAEDFDFRDEYALPDALAMALTFQARRAFARGLPHGYRTEEEALYTVRGRIRFDEQLRRRFGVALPVEVRYDEFTEDVLANQLVKAAAYRLGRMHLRAAQARRNLGWLVSLLDNVSGIEFPANDVPAVQFDRLNEHYRGVVELSRLILRHGAFESGRGQVRASGFLMNMNVVFQEFVTLALREELRLSERSFPAECRGRRVMLDETERVRLEPDLSWWDGPTCVFVGDAKYKNLTGHRIPNADLYQMIAYATALDLPGGLLIYAQDEAEPREYRVRHSGRRLEVAALDLAGTLDQALNRVRELSEKVMALRDEALAGRGR
ncbi:MAG: hypothetical protein F4W95_08485 [Chloroflexi bacterium]|nr:hypothetical protein [Chloroflexota bacterium]MYD48510.1 hypothetical protein [Chloroflexota bacterium]